MSPSRLEDTTNFLLGSAMIKENMLDDLKGVILRISDRGLREVLENTAKTVRIMKSEDKGEPYTNSTSSHTSKNQITQRGSPLTREENSSATEIAEVASVVETSEKPAEQTSRWWLWLIGALVVGGGLGLVLRRKS